MEHIPQLGIDLALVLALAAIATIVCKRFNQPLILGYVVAGFLVSPAIGWMPNIVDTENISTLSEIGVIFLMFGLGLEFSIIRLTKVGKPGITTALTEMILMIAAGFLCGTLMGWSFFTSLFLGGMLAISSTTIIVKTFDELGLKGKKFTELVFGSLIIEDIVGIFLMVILSTLAVGSAVDGGAVIMQLGQMALYLVIWFALSVLVVPTFIKKVSGALNDEVLLITSIALCLLMVALANAIGFSAALGAFMAGSILAGTVQVHRIEKLFNPIKNLFGAIFFVSVGMLVSPQAIIENIIPIIIVTVITLLGKPLFTALGALIGKQSLKTSIQTGMSLSQIGEFSFIIAALGVSLGVTEDFLYPIIIAVSVVTTITTPFYIKNSDKMYRLAVRILPQSALDFFERRAHCDAEDENSSAWKDYIRHWLIKVLMVVVTSIACVLLLPDLLHPLMTTFMTEEVANLIITGLTLLIVGLFISNLFYSARRGEFGALWVADRRNHIPLIIITICNFLLAAVAVFYIVLALDGFDDLWLVIPSLLITFVLSRSRVVHSVFLKIENLFVRNLNEATLAEEPDVHSDEDPVSWVENQIYITQITASRLVDRRGQEISVDLIMGQVCNLDLLSIKRDGRFIGQEETPFLTREELQNRVRDPLDKFSIKIGDELTFLGTEDEIDSYSQSMVKAGAIDEDEINSKPLPVYLANDGSPLDVTSLRIQVDADSDFKGKRISTLGLRESYGSLLIALEHGSLLTLKPSYNTRIAQGDYLWLLSKEENAKELVRTEDALLEGTQSETEENDEHNDNRGRQTEGAVLD
ncbi:MAG: cation:proton antiporter [Raoultibacter sp.]|jgi:CPA2 family monovalent cation:H+ antiporter-2